MPKRKAAQLDAGLLARKGAAAPAATAPQPPAADSQSSKETTAVTLRLDRERYRRLVSYGARFMPRRTNQEILIEALDAYLNQVEQSPAS
jgi:hypothetical protein